MFGAEKLLLKLLEKSTSNSTIQVAFWFFFLLHLATTFLLGWVIYRTLGQKKRDLLSWLLPIISLSMVLLIPYGSGSWLSNSIIEGWGIPLTFMKFLAFVNLLLFIISFVLYFVYKSEEEEFLA